MNIINQLRKGFNQKIKTNAVMLTGVIHAVISDGIGGFKKSLSASETVFTFIYPARIAKGYVNPGTAEKEEPKTTEEKYIIEFDYRELVKPGLTITYDSRKFEVLFPIIHYKKNNMEYGKTANLKIIGPESILL